MPSISYAEDSKLSLIISSSVVDEEISTSVARAIFTRKLTRWNNTSRIHVFVFSDEHPYHRNFVKQQLGLFPYQLRQIWDRMVFSGLGNAPDTVSSVEEMCRSVANTPGAIGYVPVSSDCQSQGVRYVVMD